MRRSVAIGLAVVLAGCAPSGGDAGYAEIALAFLRTAGDVYRLNAVPLDELKGKASAIVREPVGTGRLELERYGRLYLLCNFTVRKNRIVTVTVLSASGGFQCDVKD